MRLIDADALKQMLPAPIEDEYKYVHKIIDNAPTLPNPCDNPCNFTIPIGEWKIGGKTTHYHYCSICGKDGDLQDNFCRNCGAKMKGDEE